MQKQPHIMIANQLNVVTMKKYVVLKNYEHCLPDVKGVFASHEEAAAFAQLYAKTDSASTYSVAIIIATTSEQ